MFNLESANFSSSDRYKWQGGKKLYKGGDQGSQKGSPNAAARTPMCRHSCCLSWGGEGSFAAERSWRVRCVLIATQAQPDVNAYFVCVFPQADLDVALAVQRRSSE